VLPDHPTPVEKKTHSEAPVPFAVLSSEDRNAGSGGYNEGAAARSGWFIADASRLFDDVFLA
jgi:2,3-bisphosphoglycerate-independent phosphoglycerate mutase